MQAVVGEIDAISRFPEARRAAEQIQRGEKAGVEGDTCDGSTKAERINAMPAYIYDNGYYYVHYQVGTAGESLPYPSSPTKPESFRYDESNGPSLQTQLALDLVKKYLPQYQKAASDAFGTPLELDIDFNSFLRTSKALPGSPLDGGWATDYIQDGLEELLSRLPQFIREYNRQANEYYKAEIPLVKKNLKKIKIVVTAPDNDAPQDQEFKGGTLNHPRPLATGSRRQRHRHRPGDHLGVGEGALESHNPKRTMSWPLAALGGLLLRFANSFASGKQTSTPPSALLSRAERENGH